MTIGIPSLQAKSPTPPVIDSAKNFSFHLCSFLFLAFLMVNFTIPAQAEERPPTNIETLRALAERWAAADEATRSSPAFRLHQAGDTIQVVGSQLSQPQLVRLARSGHPVYYMAENLNAAKTLSTDEVWYSPFGLNGSGITSGMMGHWDDGHPYPYHQEFGSRLSLRDGSGNYSYHATHVAGTLIANGENNNAKGMAPNGRLWSYDFQNDAAEMATAAADGMLISNHSYGDYCGWGYRVLMDDQGNLYTEPAWYGDGTIDSQVDYKFGFYNEWTRNFDEIAYNAPYYLIVKSAGNDRDNDGYPAGTEYWYQNPDNGYAWELITDPRGPDYDPGGYDTLTPPGSAKNILTIGAIRDLPSGYYSPAGVNFEPYSSWGPTDDGRIKPDLVANGQNLFSTTPYGYDTYDDMYGTSCAAPNVTGSVALLIDHYQDTHGEYPLASTMKAILFATADETGAGPGPDYEYGWGLMNTHTAAGFIEDGSIIEDQLVAGETDYHHFMSDGTEPIVAVLVWTDPPGTVPAASVDPPDLQLVHDLDLRAQMDCQVYEPYILDPAHPDEPSETGDNFRDNSEVIRIEPTAGHVRFEVRHKGTLTASQHYSLVVRGVQPATTVRPEGDGTFPSIQAAIDGTQDETTIILTEGVHIEDNIVLRSGVTLLGGSCDPAEVVVDAQGVGVVLFVLDSVNSANVQNITIRGASGSGVSISGGEADFTNCHFTNNGGSAVGLESSSANFTACLFADSNEGFFGQWFNGSMTDCLVSGNNNPGLNFFFSETQLTNCDVIGNGGGGVSSYESILTIEGCRFEENIGNLGGGLSSNGWGGVTASDCVFVNNQAAEGGGVYSVSSGGSSYTDCQFVSNTATERGGGFANDYTGIQFEECRFSLNTAPSGAGLDLLQCSSELIRCDFFGNHGHGFFSETPEGPDPSQPVLQYCTFVDNENFGLEIIRSDAIISTCEIRDNAGGVRCYGNDGLVRLEDCIISGNSTDGLVGGVFCQEGNIQLNTCVVYENQASSGAGLSTRYGGNVQVENCTFADNTATGGTGGGILIFTMTDASITNTISAFNNGTGITIAGVSDPVISCTDLYGNTDGNWEGSMAEFGGINGNIEANPLFINRSQDLYGLAVGSPCANPVGCGLIGAIGAMGPAASVYTQPDGSGQSLSQCYGEGGVLVDATITVGFDYPWVPVEDIWLASTWGGLIVCSGGAHPDGPADMNGLLTFSGPVAGGHYTNPSAGEMVEVIYLGVPITNQAFNVQFNSPDINGDLWVNLPDIGLFSTDFFGQYAYRSDFYWDGTINLSDIGLFASALGSTCPNKSGDRGIPLVSVDPEISLGIYFDPEGKYPSVQTGSATVGEAYLMATGPVPNDLLTAWQCRIDTSPNLVVTERELGTKAINMAEEPDFAVGLGEAPPKTKINRIRLMRLRYELLDDAPAYFRLLPPGFDEGGIALAVGRKDPVMVYVLPAANQAEGIVAFVNDPEAPGPVLALETPQRELQLRNVPNPFNPTTTICFHLNQEARVEVRIYDASGKRVRTLQPGILSAGSQRLDWGGKDQGGRQLASGVYLYQLWVNGQQEGPPIKTTLLK